MVLKEQDYKTFEDIRIKWDIGQKVEPVEIWFPRCGRRAHLRSEVKPLNLFADAMLFSEPPGLDPQNEKRKQREKAATSTCGIVIRNW